MDSATVPPRKTPDSKELTSAVQRAPEVTAYLLEHGSLEDGSPTFIALELVSPALLTDRLWGKRYGQPCLGTPFHSVSEYLDWRIRVAYPHPAYRYLSLPWALEVRYPFPMLEQAFAQLDAALRSVGVGLRRDPENIREKDARVWGSQPTLRLGNYWMHSWPRGILCPLCGESGGGGQLLLYRTSSMEDVLVCDEEDSEYVLGSPPWHQYADRDVWRNSHAASWKLRSHVPYSPWGTDFKRAERLFSEALESRKPHHLPSEDTRRGSILTLELSEPLGRWHDTIWRFWLMRDQPTTVAIYPVGNTAPDWVIQRNEKIIVEHPSVWLTR